MNLSPSTRRGRGAEPPRESKRQRLDSLLANSTAGTLITVEAGAGYGKSTLLQSWQAIGRQPCAIIAVEARHDSLAEFGRLVTETLGRVSPPVAELLPAACSTHPDWTRELLPALIGRLRVAPVVPLFDDLHLVSDPDVLDFLGSFVTEQLATTPVVLSGRRLPPLHLRRRPRLSWRVTASQLTLAARDVVVAAQGAVSPETASEIVAATGGWPAAVQVALAGRRRPRRSPLAPLSFEADLATYLEEQALSALPEPLLETLMVAAAVAPADRGTLAAAVGDVDLDAHLRELTAQSLPLLSFGPEAEPLRLHHLLRDILAERFRRTAGPRRREVITAAADHLLAEGREREAFVLVAQLEDPERLADFVAVAGLDSVLRGHTLPVRGWLESFDAAKVLSDPRLMLIHALACAADCDFVGVQQWLAYYARATHGATASDTDSDVIAAALWEIMGLQPIGEAARSAAELELGAFTVLGQVLTAVTLGTAGMFDAAHRVLDSLTPGADGYPLLEILRDSTRGILLGRVGRHAEAAAIADACVARVADSGLLTNPLMVGLEVIQASHAAEMGDAQRARELIARGRARLADLQGGLSLPRLCWTAALAEAAISLGELPTAAILVAEAAELAEENPEASEVLKGIESAQERLTTAGRPERLGLTTAELGVVRYLDSYWPVPRIAAELGVSPATARTHIQSAYRKLGVHRRDEAVQAARTLGILPTAAG